MSKRDYIRMKTKLVSAICQLVRFDEDKGEFVRVIHYELSKVLTEDEILSRFDWHHFPIPKAHGGPDAHWNLQPMQKDAHREVTAKEDIPRIAKGKRVDRAATQHRERMASKEPGKPRERTGSIPPRPFQKGHRPLRSGAR